MGLGDDQAPDRRRAEAATVTLDELLDEMGGEVVLVPEIKPGATSAEVDQVLDEFDERGLSDSLIVQSFDFSAAKTIAERGYTSLYLTGVRPGRRSPSAEIKDAGIDWVGPSTKLPTNELREPRSRPASTSPRTRSPRPKDGHRLPHGSSPASSPTTRGPTEFLCTDHQTVLGSGAAGADRSPTASARLGRSLGRILRGRIAVIVVEADRDPLLGDIAFACFADGGRPDVELFLLLLVDDRGVTQLVVPVRFGNLRCRPVGLRAHVDLLSSYRSESFSSRRSRMITMVAGFAPPSTGSGGRFSRA
jgi:hypothetical protein